MILNLFRGKFIVAISWLEPRKFDSPYESDLGTKRLANVQVSPMQFIVYAMVGETLAERQMILKTYKAA